MASTRLVQVILLGVILCKAPWQTQVLATSAAHKLALGVLPLPNLLRA